MYITSERKRFQSIEFVTSLGRQSYKRNPQAICSMVKITFLSCSGVWIIYCKTSFEKKKKTNASLLHLLDYHDLLKQKTNMSKRQFREAKNHLKGKTKTRPTPLCHPFSAFADENCGPRTLLPMLRRKQERTPSPFSKRLEKTKN